VFANEVERVEGTPEPGSIVAVYYGDGKWAGTGYFNAQSQIMVRLLSREKAEEINDGIFPKKAGKLLAL
jgi:23S rRNA (cytosine1962-C5)-methyltransferase